jgi:hypothetical protein
MEKEKQNALEMGKEKAQEAQEEDEEESRRLIVSSSQAASKLPIHSLYLHVRGIKYIFNGISA